MKAIRIHAPGGLEGLVYEDIPPPRPREGEVMVRVYATGITPMELTWKTSTGAVRPLPIIPGHELSGIVSEVGPGVTDVAIGDAVYALTDFSRDGAEAEYTIALPSELAPKPHTLNHMQAAAVPLSALTAWQALFEHAKLSAGQTILVHGAAGGVGIFAVQFAHWIGANVIGTASAHSRDLLRELGADEIIDYTTTRFEDMVHDANVVIDTVGGDTLKRSWGVLRKGGRLVTIASEAGPKRQEAAAHGVRASWFIVQPNRSQLAEIADLIDAGQVRVVVEAVLPLSEARQAYERGRSGHRHGKIVLRVVNEEDSVEER
jgi:NADPH:quinone reductase-like Zn-dependent oxidoreductase